MNELPPDEPRWVQARAMLEAGTPTAGGAVIDDAAHLAVALPGADPAALAAAIGPRRSWTLLVPTVDEAAAEAIQQALASHGWSGEAASLYAALASDDLANDDGAAIAGDDRAALLAHVTDPALAAELSAAPGPLVAIAVEGVPAAFAYGAWRTARHVELTTQTLPAYRQLGLGVRVAAGLARVELAQGRGPVMGALDSSAVAHRLANRIGLVEVARMRVLWSPA
ncbi:MAG: hypothetical protein K8W52_41310 [Deltaproteobacteria bacterium]|nr:hypothetical protein [Deltaproteobacteria bacterium]